MDLLPCAKFEVSSSSRSKVIASWISSPVPNLKCLAQAVQKLWPRNRNPRWRPAAILDFYFCQFRSFGLVQIVGF